MQFWLVKSEPDVYSFDQLIAEGRTFWSGVRNAQARNNLQAMRVGDRALYYHSNEGKEIVGIATIVAEAYPDPTSPEDPRWVVVDVAPHKRLRRPVTLAVCKEDPVLKDTALVRQGRLSVMPVTVEQYARALELGGGEAPL
jgi:predicted RNA-binding protein with PUA-like domain